VGRVASRASGRVQAPKLNLRSRSTALQRAPGELRVVWEAAAENRCEYCGSVSSVAAAFVFGSGLLARQAAEDFGGDLLGCGRDGKDRASLQQVAKLRHLADRCENRKRRARIADSQSAQHLTSVLTVEVESGDDEVGSFDGDAGLEPMQRTPRRRISRRIGTPADPDGAARTADRGCELQTGNCDAAALAPFELGSRALSGADSRQYSEGGRNGGTAVVRVRPRSPPDGRASRISFEGSTEGRASRPPPLYASR
jgi:hypothetical protein